MKINNVKMKEEYTLKQYRSLKYSIDKGLYEKNTHEILIVGDNKFDANHISFLDSEKITQAYDDALILNVDSQDSILEYVNKYGLPVSDNNYIFLQERMNHLQEYIRNSEINTFFNADDLNDINSLFYTQKAMSLFQAIVRLQKDLTDYSFYDEDSSKLRICEIACNIFQDLIRVMILLDHNCLVPSIKRYNGSNYSLNIKNSNVTLIFNSYKDFAAELLKYLDNPESYTNSSLFVYDAFRKLDFNSTAPTIEPLLSKLISSGKCSFSHGKLSACDTNSIPEINPFYNTAHTLLLIKISEAAANICEAKKQSFYDIFIRQASEINFNMISEKYNLTYKKDRNTKICEEIHNAAELFYFEIFTDLLVNCPPTVKLEKDIVIYSRQMPNLIQALFNKLYREAFIEYKICSGCGRAFPAKSRRSDAEYCSETCANRIRKQRSRQKQNEEDS